MGGTFNNISKYIEKTTDMLQVTEKVNHIKMHSVPLGMGRIQTCNYCNSRCKSNYHTMVRVEIPFAGTIQPHFCACPKSGPKISRRTDECSG